MDMIDLRAAIATSREKADWLGALNGYNNVVYHATEAAAVVDAYLRKAAILAVHLGQPDKATDHLARAAEMASDDAVREAALVASDALRAAGASAEAAYLGQLGLGA